MKKIGLYFSRIIKYTGTMKLAVRDDKDEYLDITNVVIKKKKKTKPKIKFIEKSIPM